MTGLDLFPSVELSDLKVDFLKEKSELNNLINDLRKNIGDQQRSVVEWAIVEFFVITAILIPSSASSEMKNMDETITDLRSRLSNADREYLVKLRASREEEWVKISRLETEKNEVIIFDWGGDKASYLDYMTFKKFSSYLFLSSLSNKLLAWNYFSLKLNRAKRHSGKKSIQNFLKWRNNGQRPQQKTEILSPRIKRSPMLMISWRVSWRICRRN